MRVFLAALLLAGTAASAQSVGIAGRGRISLMPGWNYAPNGPFFANANYHTGAVLSERPKGGPTAFASFGYGASEALEVGVDLFGAFEAIQFGDRGAFNRISYGAGLVGRYIFQPESLPLQPYLATGVMGTLVNSSGAGFAGTESFVTGYLVGAGVDFSLGDTYAVGVGYRFMLARGRAPEDVQGSINGGGHFFLLSLSYYLPGEPPKSVQGLSPLNM